MKRDITLWVITMTFLFTVFVGLSVSTQTSAADRSTVENFVTRFYELCLGHSPDSASLNGWVEALLDGYLTASDFANGFVSSKDFLNKNTTNEEYLQILYEAFFNRQLDPVGLQEWLDAMQNGVSREDVLDEFIHAKEFEELCEEYGIKAYEGHFTKSQREAVEAFVTRFYQLCLGRNPDAAGVDGWTNNLLNQIQTGADVANGFIYSQEFINQNTDNDEYLTILYKAFFNRDPDQAGWDVWISELNAGRDRGEVLNGFINSEEFNELTKAYGIETGQGKLSGFLHGTICDMFTGEPIGNSVIILNSIFESGAKDLKFHCLPDGKYIFPPLRPGTYSLSAMAPDYTTKYKSEIVLQEAELKVVEFNLVPIFVVENFVTRFYQECLVRDPDAAGLDGWTNNLLNQIQTGADVANGFIYSQEFINKNTTNEEYLTILYKAFFDRSPDQAGWDVWIAELKGGKDRGYVLDGFLYSQEFIQLCENYGINPY